MNSNFIISKKNKLGLFIFILFLHCVMLLAITQHSSNEKRASQPAIQLVFLPQQVQKLINLDPITRIKPKVAIVPTHAVKQNKTPILSTKNHEAILSNEIVTNEAIHTPESTSLPSLNLDVKTITKEMKKEFERGEKSNYKSKYKTFSATIASTYVAKQNGVQVEQVHAFDGRPISKVTTPYGTYCLRHYKPGEKLEMTPPSYAMTCDNY